MRKLKDFICKVFGHSWTTWKKGKRQFFWSSEAPHYYTALSHHRHCIMCNDSECYHADVRPIKAHKVQTLSGKFF